MKRKKYAINKDFKKWSKVNPPINKFFTRVIQFFLGFAFNFQRSSRDCKIEKKTIVLGDKKVKFLIYTPAEIDDNSPCLIYYHGGGFMLPAASHHYNNARRYATESKCKVIFPDYPLAPKNKFPVPPNSCFDFYKMVIENSQEFNINPDKIIVGGDSAGAMLSGMVSMMASDNNIKAPLAQMLIYPVVGIEEPTESMLQFDDTGMCNSKDFEKYCNLYFRDESDKKNRYASLLNQEDLSRYPSTYLETAEFDCLRDEGKVFAKRLQESGVEVTMHNTKATIHGYDIVEKSPISKDSILKRIEFLKEQFNK